MRKNLYVGYETNWKVGSGSKKVIPDPGIHNTVFNTYKRLRIRIRWVLSGTAIRNPGLLDARGEEAGGVEKPPEPRERSPLHLQAGRGATGVLARKKRGFRQGFGSGSVSGSGSAWIRSCWIRIRIQIADPDPGGQKWPQKTVKKDRIFIFWSAGCSLLRAEGFSCSLGVLYGGLGINKLQFLIKKIKIMFLVVSFFQF